MRGERDYLIPGSRGRLLTFCRLAGLPKTVLENAQLRADCLKVETQERMVTALARRTQRLLQSTFSNVTDSAATLRNAALLYKAVKLVVKE